MAPLPTAGDSGLGVVYHALAAVAAVQAAQQAGLVLGRTILFRSPCHEALTGLQHGDFRRPAAQDAAMLLGAACLDLGLAPPLFVPRIVPGVPPAPGSVLAQPEVDWDASSPSLRTFLRELADTAGARLTLDIFACSTSSLTTRYFSADPDPRAEGHDAFAQPDWGTSLCPRCHCRHQEFVVLTPPHSAVARALRKAHCDEATGVLVVPYQITAPWWPLATSASLTPSPPVPSLPVSAGGLAVPSSTPPALTSGRSPSASSTSGLSTVAPLPRPAPAPWSGAAPLAWPPTMTSPTTEPLPFTPNPYSHEDRKGPELWWRLLAC